MSEFFIEEAASVLERVGIAPAAVAILGIEGLILHGVERAIAEWLFHGLHDIDASAHSVQKSAGSLADELRRDIEREITSHLPFGAVIKSIGWG